MIKQILAASMVFCFSGLASAMSIEGIEFAETKSLEGKSLQLNGVGLRKVHRFGIPVKVYVAGLYAETKASTLDALWAQSGPKVLRMQFVRNVEQSSLEDAFRAGYDDNCLLECEATKKAQLREFLAMLSDVRKDHTVEMTFFKDRVDIDFGGRKPARKSLAGEAFSKNLLAIFIGQRPPTEDLKKGLLGVK